MVRLTVGKQLAVGAKRAHVQIVQIVATQHTVIPAVFHLLGQHSFYFVIRYQTVAIVEAAVGVAGQRIGGEVNRALLAICLRNVNGDQGASFQHHFPYLRVGQQVHADFLAVIQAVKQFPAHLGDVGDALNRELPLLFPHPQQHDAAPRVGKGAVSGPKILRHRALPVAAGRLLALQVHGFPEQVKVGNGLNLHHARVSIRHCVSKRFYRPTEAPSRIAVIWGFILSGIAPVSSKCS